MGSPWARTYLEELKKGSEGFENYDPGQKYKEASEVLEKYLNGLWEFSPPAALKFLEPKEQRTKIQDGKIIIKPDWAQDAQWEIDICQGDNWIKQYVTEKLWKASEMHCGDIAKCLMWNDFGWYCNAQSLKLPEGVTAKVYLDEAGNKLKTKLDCKGSYLIGRWKPHDPACAFKFSLNPSYTCP